MISPSSKLFYQQRAVGFSCFDAMEHFGRCRNLPKHSSRQQVDSSPMSGPVPTRGSNIADQAAVSAVAYVASHSYMEPRTDTTRLQRPGLSAKVQAINTLRASKLARSLCIGNFRQRCKLRISDDAMSMWKILGVSHVRVSSRFRRPKPVSRVWKLTWT